MKASEIREKSLDELMEYNKEQRKALFDLRFKHYTGQLISTADIRNARREIARVETIIREREIVQRGKDA
ncbi:50S ribosomal protein L29 [Myxococcota bacterium]|nr:50S ribosomal protein L29 [Myxococcota bacterium]MBU1430965.1 50S ribosomal protein L29 [Myxococcota bacterium]MBU1897240.1 50S ribosomal protein L29 [Myxococcota bacterium]